MRWVCGLLVLVVCGCGGGASSWQGDGRLKVLSTIGMIEDLVAQVGGEYIDSRVLIRGELDPHSYELVKGDDEKFASADLIFYNGLGLEHGLSLRRQLEGNPKAVAVCAPLLEKQPEAILDVGGQYDPHVWMDVSLWMETLEPIVEALSRADPVHREAFVANGARVRAELEVADREAYARLQAVPEEKRFLVTSHDAFHYFARRYLAPEGEERWEKRCEAPEGLAPDAQLSVTDLQLIIAHVAEHGIGVLFPESNVNRDALKKIVQAGRQKGCALRLCPSPLYGDAMGEGQSYVEMIAHNVNVIAEELAQ